jgi:hypothetical protein
VRIPGRGRRRRPELPADLGRELGVTDERVLAWAELAGGGVAAATVQGLRVRTPQGRLVRRPWTDVDHAAWDDASGTLAVWWLGSRIPTPLEVGPDTFLPEVVHERVRSSIVLSRELPLPGGRTAYVTLRKGADGELTTHTVTPRGARLDDPEIAALVRKAEADLRDEAGGAAH